ncbi:SixA phosphatase family protein [Sulfurimonas autotrophica]|uniref:Putative phosphohistidine phosphatase, SixA n=1 Tax=Sulfurimonas autotrophica (strain ATCC BAA-671 / DSM 16294 / JCM 11897 / OK10) TaxID=563040 RepID=E0UQ33_SULAO|nr:histidine phosphatase family protein [Sulfurimonas autotrophica]ADN08708.1 putative phosphohistidine phosphatase, SixA [Sulfurimonas autotrophica DSM 16294]
MKTLYIIRHAKSSWKDLNLDDFERPLNKRGKNDAPQMSKRLKQQGIYPDIILSSPAKRAKQTAKAIAKEISYDEKIRYIEDIYEASPNTLENILHSLDDKYETVFLIGHNPGLNMLVEKYVDFEENIPTGGVVSIKFDTKEWKNISRKYAELLWFDYPKKSNKIS